MKTILIQIIFKCIEFSFPHLKNYYHKRKSNFMIAICIAKSKIRKMQFLIKLKILWWKSNYKKLQILLKGRCRQ
jgi:hypothetical protein